LGDYRLINKTTGCVNKATSCVVFDCETEMWHFQQDKFTIPNMLRVIHSYNDVPVLSSNGLFLYMPRLCSADVILEALDYAYNYDYIVFDYKVFLQSTFTLEQEDLFTKFPNGETCRKALGKLLIKKQVQDKDFLCVQDDGTRTVVGPIYYALRELKWLRTRNAFPNNYKAPSYTVNYHSTSNSDFTRATHKFDYLKYFGNWDYIICPALKGQNQTELLEKLESESREGFIIFGGFEKLKDIPFTKRVKVNKGVFVYVSKFNKSKKTYEILPGRMSTNQLVNYLQRDFTG